MSAGQFWIVGCGAMAGAMLHRWVDCGMDARRLTVVDPGMPNAPAGVRCVADFPNEAPPAWLMLGVKPQMLADIAPKTASYAAADTTVISILAGTLHATLASSFPNAGRIVRAMPNLPVAIGRGAVALYGTDVRDDIGVLMAPLGLIEWIDDEAQFDAVTALSGSGPAFVYRFAHALAAGGVALGLAPALADRLARATVSGAAELAQASPFSLHDLADRVASKGGSTRMGLDVLDADAALLRLVAATMAAAERRNAAMADPIASG